MLANSVILFRSLPLTKNDLNSLDFVIYRFFVTLFKTSDISIVKTCQSLFSFDLPIASLLKNVIKSSKTVYDVMCV